MQNPLKKKLTVNAIVEDFAKKIDQLQAVAVEMQKTAEQKEIEMLEAEAARDDALNEKERALKVSAKISQLLE